MLKMNLIIILLNLMFINSKNPLISGLILILQTMLISMILGKSNYTFWMSFIIFLVFIGGMLILFMYVISMLNNNLMKFLKIKFLMVSFIYLLFTFSYYLNYETLTYNKLFHFNKETTLNLLKLYNMPNMIINMMIIIYLFIMMIVSTKITSIMMGPFFKY